MLFHVGRSPESWVGFLFGLANEIAWREVDIPRGRWLMLVFGSGSKKRRNILLEA